jgi:plastocyanin
VKKAFFVFSILLLVFHVGAVFANPTALSDPAWPPSSEISNLSPYHIVPLDKIVDSPVRWVTAGGGVLAFGSGQWVGFSLEEDPSTIISSLSFDHTVSEGLVLGRHAFLSQDGLGLRILDLEDSSNPVDLGFYALLGSAFHLASWGNFLFVGDDRDGVRALEIYPSEQENVPYTSQTILVDQGFIHVGKPITAITVSAGGKAYVATENEVRVYDISDPSKPVEVDRFSINLPVRSMGVNGSVLFLAAGDEGLHIVDLSVPGIASTLTTLRIPSESLYLAGRRVYLAAGTGGLNVLQVGPNAPATFDVQVGDSGFVPYAINIHTGDTIRWIWAAPGYPTISGTSHFLNAISDFVTEQGRFRSPHTFNKPGTFRYDCFPSCSGGLAGTVSVVTPLATGISITPPSIDFGNVTVGTPSDQTITIANTSVASVLHGTVGSLSAPFSVVSGGGVFNNVLPGQSVPVTVRFLPAAAGLSSATLTITHTLGVQTDSTDVPLSGTGVNPINISVAPATVNFGSVAIGSSSDQTITITNQSSSTGTLTGNVGTLFAPFSVVSGGGAFSLPAGQSKSVVVRFSPAALGQSSRTLSITHNAGNQTSPTNVSLSGTGTAAVINISITPASVNFGNVSLGQTLDQTVTITNQTNSTATLSGNVGSLSAPFSLVSGGGAFSLPVGQSKSIVVRFSPAATGPFSGTLSITHNAGNQTSPTNVLLGGTGIIGVVNLLITPASVDFGNVSVGTTSDQTITITNQTGSTGTLSGTVGIPSAPFSVVSGGGAFSLPVGQSKSVVVRFSPTSTEPFSGTLPITHNAGNQNSPANVPLSGTGITPIPGTINISVTPPSVNFSNVALGQLSDVTVTITNLTGSTGTLTGNVGIPSAPFSIVSGGGTFSLAPGNSKSVVVRFSPTAAGPFSGTLSITHNAGNQSSPINVPLSGTGIIGVVNLLITPASVDFGNVSVGTTSDQTITITNQISSTGTLTGNVAFVSAPFLLVGGWGPFSLVPGQSMSVTVRFFPLAAGPATGNLSITHNAINLSSPLIVPLSGNGVTPPVVIDISVSPSSVNFGDVAVGQTVDQTITITNPSDSTGTLTGSVGMPSAPFSVVSGGGAFSLSPDQTKTVTVRFSATAEEAASGTLSITHNATDQNNPINVSLEGEGVLPSGVAISFVSGPSTAKPGDRVSIQNTLTNYGTPPANNVTVNFYLSADTKIDAADTFLGKRSIRTLAPGASSGPVSTRVTIPRTVAPGSYFIGAIVRANSNFDPKGITICLPLSKSALLSPKNRGTNIATTPTLEWSDVNGVTSYEVQVGTDSKFTDIVASITGLTDTRWFVAPALSNQTTYFWRVRAVNDCGSGPWSSTWSFRTM